MKYKLTKSSVLLGSFLACVCMAGEPIKVDLPECHGSIVLPSEPKIDTSKEGATDPSVVASHRIFQGMYESKNGGQFVYQVTCNTYTTKISKYNLEKETNGYFSAMKNAQKDAKSIEVLPFVWLSEFNGYQRADLETSANGMGVRFIEGLFSSGGTNSSISVRVITNEHFYEGMYEQHIK